MDNNKEQSRFSYNYSAKEQAEIKRIREKYTPSEEVEDKMDRLRRLDASVTSTAQAVALIFGVIGALILGSGMSLCMTEIGTAVGLTGNIAMVIGVMVALLAEYLQVLHIRSLMLS